MQSRRQRWVARHVLNTHHLQLQQQKEVESRGVNASPRNASPLLHSTSTSPTPLSSSNASPTPRSGNGVVANEKHQNGVASNGIPSPYTNGVQSNGASPTPYTNGASPTPAKTGVQSRHVSGTNTPVASVSPTPNGNQHQYVNGNHLQVNGNHHQANGNHQQVNGNNHQSNGVHRGITKSDPRLIESPSPTSTGPSTSPTTPSSSSPTTVICVSPIHDKRQSHIQSHERQSAKQSQNHEDKNFSKIRPFSYCPDTRLLKEGRDALGRDLLTGDLLPRDIPGREGGREGGRDGLTREGGHRASSRSHHASKRLSLKVDH